MSSLTLSHTVHEEAKEGHNFLFRGRVWLWRAVEREREGGRERARERERER